MTTASDQGWALMKVLIITITVLLAANVAWPAAAAEIPPGAYQNTCTNIQVQKLLGGSGRNLTASC